MQYLVAQSQILEVSSYKRRLVSPATLKNNSYLASIEVSGFGKLVKNDQDAFAILPCVRGMSE
jgi:hypothetical protein